MPKKLLDKISTFTTSDKGVLKGCLVFKGSRVPVSTVLEYFAKNWTIDDICRKFPTVDREHITMLITTCSEIFNSNVKDKEGYHYLG